MLAGTAHRPRTTVVRTTVVAVVGLLVGAVALAQQRFDLHRTPTVLPKTVLPTQVRLQLTLDPAADGFSGHVRIGLRVSAVVDAIVLHAKALSADDAVLVSGARAGRRRTLQVLAGDAADTWRLVPTDGGAVPVGRHELRIRYRGTVQRTGEGLYRAHHSVGGRPARMLATQLQAVQARQLMPAFDEPMFRATYALEVLAPPGDEVLSNMPLQTRRAAPPKRGPGSLVLHRFAATPPMPSYLLAIAVGRFDVLEGEVDGIPLRIFTAPGKRAQAAYAMEATRQVLPFFRHYFGRPYALPKLDQLAVPGTRQGAMEDWGLISYVEDGLLIDPARSGPAAQRTVFNLVAHEIAHQWFGNLVSVASWNEIWLNEAFATWMQQKASRRFHPEWQPALGVRRSLDGTFARDATPATRAIRSGPVSEASVFEIFDGITYDKGGAVLTMLEQWIGDERFRRGLAAYMAERALKPATAGDLWHHIGAAAGQPVAAVAASWTDQPGVPLLEVSAACEAGRTVVGLRQSRFTLGEPLAGGPWQLPVLLARGDERQSVLLQAADGRAEWPGCDDRLLVVNAGGEGYYRVAYDPVWQARLVAGFAVLPAADQMALLSDSFALADAGRRPMAGHFALLRALPAVQGSGRAPLYGLACSQWATLDDALHGTPAQEALRAAGQALLGAELQRLGWQPSAGESNEVQVLRAELIVRLAALGHPATLAAARQRFASALTPGDPAIPASIRGAVLTAVGHDADAAEFESLLQALRAAQSPTERWPLLHALGAGRDSARAERLLQEALSGRLPPDVSAAIPGLLGSRPAMASLAYGFTVAHWPALAALAGESGGSHWLLPSAAWASSDTALAEALLVDQRRLAGTAGDSPAREAAEAIAVRQRLRSREPTALAAALADWAPR